MAKLILKDMNGDLFIRNDFTIDVKSIDSHDFRMIIRSEDLRSVWDINFSDLKAYYRGEEVDLFDFIFDKYELVKVLSIEGNDGRVTINFR